MRDGIWLETLVSDSLRLRNWQRADSEATAGLIASVLVEHGLHWEPEGADADVIQVERAYFARGGEFFVLEDIKSTAIVGTAAWQPLAPSSDAPLRAELRKMYLSPAYRRRGLGRFLLFFLEARIRQSSLDAWEVVIESASVLQAACALYREAGYHDLREKNQTKRCDVLLLKRMPPLGFMDLRDERPYSGRSDGCTGQADIVEGSNTGLVCKAKAACSEDLIALANSVALETSCVMAWLPPTIRLKIPGMWRVTLWLVQRPHLSSCATYLWHQSCPMTVAEETSQIDSGFLYLSWWRYMAGNNLQVAQRDAESLLGPGPCFWQALIPGPIQRRPLPIKWSNGWLLADVCLLRLRKLDESTAWNVPSSAGDLSWHPWEELNGRNQENDSPGHAISREVWSLLEPWRQLFEAADAAP